MYTTKQTWTLISCLLALLGSSQASHAQEDTQEEKESAHEMSATAAPFIKPESRLSVGIGIQDGNREQLGIFDNERHSGVHILLDADIKYRQDATATWWTAYIRDLGQENRLLDLIYEQQGNWGIKLGYQEMPSILPYTPYTFNQGLGTTSPVVTKPDTGAIGPEIEIGTWRDRTSLNLFKNIKNDLKFTLNLRNEEKTGTQQWGRILSFGKPAEFVLEPIDWTIHEIETNAHYMGKEWQMTVGYNFSSFENANTLVDVTYSDPTDTSHAYLSLPLDNQAHKFFLMGGYNFTPATRGTLQLSFNRALQDEHLPTADIPGLSYVDAPTHLEGKVDNTLAQLNLSSRLTPKLNVTSELRFFDENDRTPAWLIVNLAPTATTTVHSTPLSRRTISGKLEATYQLFHQTSIVTGIERKNQDREIPYGNDSDGDGLDDERFVPFRSDLDETTYKVQLRRAFTDRANGSLTLQHSDRTGDNYLDSIKIMGNADGKINPFFISDRDRNKIRLAFDVRPMTKLGLQFVAEYERDTYGPDPIPYGRQKANKQLYSMDADYAFSNNWLITSWFSHQIDEISLFTGRFPSATEHDADKNSDIDDTSNSIGLGLRNQFNNSTKIGVNLDHTWSKTRYQDEVVAALPTTVVYPTDTTTGAVLSPLPEINSKTTKLDAFVEYLGLGPGLLRFDYIYELWDTNDWSWAFSDEDSYTYGTSTTTDGTVIMMDHYQPVNFVGVSYITKF
ncbi:MAG: MtrB/PioB family decaheme-associated outer membrane protein [Magnetococcus sp. DMHC-6]